MYITTEYLKVDPWTAVIDMINNEYGTELSPYSTHLVSIESLGGTKTKIKIRTNISTSPDNTMPVVELPEYLYYDRIALATLFKGGPNYEMGNIRMPTTSIEVTHLLTSRNDVVFSATDIVAKTYPRFDTTYTLSAKAESLRFVGDMEFSFVNTLKYNLSEHSMVTEYPKANTWQQGNDGTKITGNYLFTGYDFTEYRDDLRESKIGQMFYNSTRLRIIINRVTGQDWILSAEDVPNNLTNNIFEGELRTRIAYNGVCDPAYTTRTDMSYVMVLELSPTLCSNVSGFLLFHYN